MKHTDPQSEYTALKSMADSLSFTNIKADRRVQVKMPSFVVDLLDQEFPQQDRSQVITQAALDLLLRIKRLKNPKLEDWVREEQHSIDRMWTYLDERDH